MVGKFTVNWCDSIFPNGLFDCDNSVWCSNPDNNWIDGYCLTKNEIKNYLKNKKGFGWHIDNLKIYDKPKELKEFGKTRPPQSWCYL